MGSSGRPDPPPLAFQRHQRDRQAATVDEFRHVHIPVVEQIKRTLNIDLLLMGFGLDDDQIHSPNAKFEMSCFTRAHVRTPSF
jgi:hypothetical protein